MDASTRKEIGSLVAMGKTDEEIQIIMGYESRRIARRRVQTWMGFHKAATRTYAVVKAIAAQEIDAVELARMTAIVLLCTATMFTPPRIAPKRAPKRATTEQVVRRRQQILNLNSGTVVVELQVKEKPVLGRVIELPQQQAVA